MARIRELPIRHLRIRLVERSRLVKLQQRNHMRIAVDGRGTYRYTQYHSAAVPRPLNLNTKLNTATRLGKSNYGSEEMLR